MNIFYLHTSPQKAAQMMCDKHIIKMILESIQLLWSCHYSVNEDLSHLKLTIVPYRKTHFNHPSAVWVRTDVSHYVWLVLHVKELHNVYYQHFGQKMHKSYPHILFLEENVPPLENEYFQQPPQAMPDEYKQRLSQLAYREYYIHSKKDILSYRCSRILPTFLAMTDLEIVCTHQYSKTKIKICQMCKYTKV